MTGSWLSLLLKSNTNTRLMQDLDPGLVHYQGA
jgi:hypothetical protein